METKLRNEISDEFKWDLTQIYKDKDEFDIDCDKILDYTKKIVLFNGKLTDTKELKKCLDLSTKTSKMITKLFCYANMYLDQEQNNEDADKLVQKVKDAAVKFSSKCEFITDEIIHFNDDIISNILSCEDLEVYHFDIKDTLKN